MAEQDLAAIRTHVAHVLAIDVGRLQDDTDLLQFGLDSLALVEIFAWLEARFRIAIAMGEGLATLFEAPTVGQLHAFVRSSMRRHS
ncbi:acyl carrier protein [Actinomadura fulvescens]|uniref:Carrier domain-containing protein n=1 Tax=Actinomadura fulvescens TaxID=46160 RepID=A0ABN3Q2G9_9ACTN